MSKEFNKYYKNLQFQDTLNENIRGSDENSTRLELKRSSPAYNGVQTDYEKKIDNVNDFSSPTEDINDFDRLESTLIPNINRYNYIPDYNYDNQYGNNLSPEEMASLDLDPEMMQLAADLNLNIEEIPNLTLTSEELGVIVNLRNEVDAALGLTPEDSDITSSNDFSGISPEIYSKLTGRSLIEDIGIVDPQNARELEVADGIYNRDVDLEINNRDEVEESIKNELNSPQENNLTSENTLDTPKNDQKICI